MKPGNLLFLYFVFLFVAVYVLDHLGADPAFCRLLMVGGAAAGIAVYLVAKALRETRRRAALAEVALKLGLSYARTVRRKTMADLGVFNLPALPKWITGRNLMEGDSSGAHVALLDCSFSGTSRTGPQTMAVYRGAEGLPEFVLSPARFPLGAGPRAPRDDTTFDAKEEFGSHYLLAGPDLAAIDAAFGEEAIHYLALHPGWSVQSRGGTLAIFCEGSLCAPEKIPAFLGHAAAIRHALLKN